MALQYQPLGLTCAAAQANSGIYYRQILLLLTTASTRQPSMNVLTTMAQRLGRESLIVLKLHLCDLVNVFGRLHTRTDPYGVTSVDKSCGQVSATAAALNRLAG
jgi:hypothetical protein